MKLLLAFLTVFLLSLNANATTEQMFTFTAMEDVETAKVNTGKEFPEIADFRQVRYTANFNTETKSIIMQIAFVNGDVDPQPPIDIEPPLVICSLYEGTSIDEVDGLLQRIENLLANEADTKAAMAGVVSMYSDKDSLTIRIAAIRRLMYGCQKGIE